MSNSTEDNLSCPTAATTTYLVVYVCLLFLTVVVVIISAKLVFAKSKLNKKYLANNVMFWVFFLYLVAVILTVIRLPITQLCLLDPRYFTILFNWAASLIVWVSSIIPYKITRFEMSGADAVGSNITSVAYCFGIFIIILAATIVGNVFAEDRDRALDITIIVYRAFTLLNFSVEITLLVFAVRKLDKVLVNHDFESRFMWYIRATLYMRTGIAISLILKYASLLSTANITIVHMFFVITGLMCFWKYWTHSGSTGRKDKLKSKVNYELSDVKNTQETQTKDNTINPSSEFSFQV